MGLNEVLESRDMEAVEACNMAVYASVGLLDHVYEDVQVIEDEDLHEYPTDSLDNLNPIGEESLIEKEAAAIEVLEDYFNPVLEYIHGDASRPYFAETGEMEEILREKGFNDLNPDHILNYEPGLEQLDRFYDSLNSNFDKSEFDQVLGVYSSALPFTYLAESYLETEEDVTFCRFSHHSRNDGEVLWTPEMISRFNPEKQDILLIDDSWDSGRTGRRVSEEFIEDASSVTLLAHQMKFKGETLENQAIDMEIRRENSNGLLVGRDLDHLKQKNF